MGRITDALKRADSEKSSFITKNPGLGYVVGGPEKKGNTGTKVFIAFFILGLVGFLGWVFLGNPSRQEEDELLVGSRDLLYPGGESHESVSSTNPDFSSDDLFKDKLNENYQRQIVSIEETAKERISPEEPIVAKALAPTVDAPGSAIEPKNSDLIVAPAPVATPGKSNTYIVKPGDNLSRIAGYDFVYGDRNQWKKIFEANKDKIKSPDQLRVGQELLIPTLDKVAASVSAKP